MCFSKIFKEGESTEEQVPKELQRHFIRGYFDGDGHIKKLSIVLE